MFWGFQDRSSGKISWNYLADGKESSKTGMVEDEK
jgi:hypothetical protein